MISGRAIVGDQPKATLDLVRPDMSALGLSARARKARELGMRAMSLALSRPRMVLPHAHYGRSEIDGILVLQRGENASTDYYLRPRLAAAGMANVRIAPQLAWPDYLEAQSGQRAAISLAPLFASPLNDARAPVKAFDAARLGAAGLYADAPAYRGFVRDGVDGRLLPMEPAAWAEAIIELARDPARRLALAAAARERLVGMMRADPRFPPAPGA